MYKPAPPRPKKTSIVRTRTGCKGCRKRRTKCDEQKPTCSTCKRLARPCEQASPKLQFRSVSYSSTGIERPHKKCSSQRRGNNCNNLSVGSGSSPTNNIPLGHDDFWTPTPNSYASVPEDTYEKPLEWHLQDGSVSPELQWHGLCTNSTFGHQDSLQLWNTVNTSLDPFGSAARLSEPDQKSGDEITLRLPTTISPSRDPIDAVTFYMDVWRKQCLPALHFVFHRLETLSGPQMLATNIMVALSACRLSRTLPQKRLFNVSRTPAFSFRPDTGHESLSHEHYGAVMRRMASWSHRDFDANPTLGLAVLVLFCYLESSMGNFQEFRLHSEGAKKLIQHYPDWTARHGTELLAAWVEIEMQSWWRRVYFSTPDFHRNHSSLSLQPKLEDALNTSNHQRASVMLILCESHRLNIASVVSCWDSHGHADSGNDDALFLATPGTSNFGMRFSVNQYSLLMQNLSEKLDMWYALLPSFDLPQFEPGRENGVGLGETDLDIRPLSFNSHTSAMNFAYYVTARVMQCTGPLESLEPASHKDIDEAYEEAEAWISMLLRIAAGIDWDQCTRLNVYTIGLVSLLLACVLRSRSLAIGLWIEDWLGERLKGDDFEEGNFPVFQILGVLRLINNERREGWDVFSLFQTVDDGGGSGKLGSYHSQRLISLWVYGRCRTTGRMHSYCRTVG